MIAQVRRLTLDDVDSYASSTDFNDDLAITQHMWSEPTVTGTAGAYVFLLYLSLPVLLNVRSDSGQPARSSLDGDRERAFLMNITGCTESDHWRGGISNRRVQRQASLLGRRHVNFTGMRLEYLDFISTVVALAPLEVRAHLGAPVDVRLRSGYWRYMRHATSLLNAGIGDEVNAGDRCRDFIDTWATPSAEGSRMCVSLRAHHPWHVDRAVPMLPGRARAVVSNLMRQAT
jgi:hypothetical protein